MINYQGRWGRGDRRLLRFRRALRAATRGARNVTCPDRAQPEPDRRSRGAHPDAVRVDTAPRWASSMTLSRPAEVQTGCGAAKGGERD